MKLCLKKNLKVTDLKNDYSFYKYNLKMPKYDIFCDKSRVFSIYMKLCVKLLLLNC